MLRYIRFDYSFKKKYKILLLFSINLILVILIYSIIINNYNSISNNDISNFINEIKLTSKQFKEKDLKGFKEKIFKLNSIYLKELWNYNFEGIPIISPIKF
jgi:hypothetical protein